MTCYGENVLRWVGRRGREFERKKVQVDYRFGSSGKDGEKRGKAEEEEGGGHANDPLKVFIFILLKGSCN